MSSAYHSSGKTADQNGVNNFSQTLSCAIFYWELVLTIETVSMKFIMPICVTLRSFWMTLVYLLLLRQCSKTHCHKSQKCKHRFHNTIVGLTLIFKNHRIRDIWSTCIPTKAVTVTVRYNSLHIVGVNPACCCVLTCYMWLLKII